MDETLASVVNNLSQPFWDGASQNRLVLPRCQTTGRPFWPPSPTSPFVTGGAVDWTEVESEAELISLVVYRRVFQQRLAARMPYGIALVALHGVRLQAHVADPDHAPAPGQPVRLGFMALGDDTPPVLHLLGPSGSG